MIYIIIIFLSLLGALLTSSKPQRFRFFGFIIWVCSNGLIAIDYYYNNNIEMMLLFGVGYQFFNLRGVYNNWRKL